MSAEFPMRPLTVGEVLDAGVSVLRHKPVLLAYAAVLAAAEQAALSPLRSSLGVGRVVFFPLGHSFGSSWLALSIGMGAEASILALLGGWCGPAAVRLLLRGVPGAQPHRPRRRRLAVIATAMLAGAGATALCYAGFIGWVFWFMLTGLAIPALTVDGGVPDTAGRRLGAAAAIGRGFAFAARGGLRAGRVRLLAWLPWLPVRLALALVGGAGAASLFGVTSHAAATGFDWALWIAVNAVMYATIACVDAACHVETRMRVEGLDIRVRQAVRRGLPAATALAAPR